MQPFPFTWWSCQVIRLLGFLVLAFGLYAFIPGVPFPSFLTDMPRWYYGALSIFSGAVIVTTAESWLVWFKTERNTAEIAERLRRIETWLEYIERRRSA